jgi:opacity protein-like surface antigen
MKKTWLVCYLLVAGMATGIVTRVEAHSIEEWESGRWVYRGEVFGGVGWGGFWHGDSPLGSGLEVGGGIGLRPFRGNLRGLGFEVQVKQLRHDVQHSSTHSTSGKASTVLGNALYHFGNSRFQPYVVGGIGVLKADYTRRGYSEWYNLPEWEYHEEYWTERVNESKVAINVGVGLKAAISPNLSIRPELSLIDTTPGSGYNWASLRLSLSVGYHW